MTDEELKDCMEAMSVLEQAKEMAEGLGYEVTGWNMQYDYADGYAIWLYRENDEVDQTSLFDSVEGGETMLEAARNCLAAVLDLGERHRDLVGEA